jgi:uncharacterized membrane protein
MFILLFLTLVYLIAPVLILVLTAKSKLANRVGAVIIAYGVGILIGNVGLFPLPGAYLTDYVMTYQGVTLQDILFLQQKGLISAGDVLAYRIQSLQDIFLTITIPVSLPLLLFSLNVKIWFRMAGKTALSMLIAILALIFILSIGIYWFGPKIPEIANVSGMLVGLYTGGTPNLAALKLALNVDAETYLKVHTYDMIPSLGYLIFLVSIGKWMFRKFLPHYPFANSGEYDNISFTENAYDGIFRRKKIFRLLIAIGLSVVIFGLAGSLTLVVKKETQMLVVILAITTFSILASLIPAVNRIDKTFEAGMFFILIFCVVVASMANMQRLADLSGALFAFITWTIFGTLLLHTLFSKICKIDADTLMITSTALMCSPPFVPMIAGALNNKEIVVSGLTVGIMGYAIGNYLGVLIAGAVHIFY